MRIGGNTAGTVQQKADGNTVNAIGERVTDWFDLVELLGWLDLMDGTANYTTANSKTQESTHIFMCDYVPIDQHPENKRMVVNGDLYDILLIDDPMGAHQHLEIYLKYVGVVV